jgi:hypothetical protein
MIVQQGSGEIVYLPVFLILGRAGTVGVRSVKTVQVATIVQATMRRLTAN